MTFLVTVIAAVAALVGTAAAEVDPAQVQRVLRLLSGVSSEYADAFDDQGKLVRPTEIEEARMLLVEVGEQIKPLLTSKNAAQLDPVMIRVLVDQKVRPQAIAGPVEGMRNEIMRLTGVRDKIVPERRPSPERGREVYQANCIGCHGAGGAGDGADVARLGVKPAAFSDLDFMRAETPQDAFNVITLGRKTTGMPAWGDALSIQDIWDVISFVWSFSRTPEAVAEGQRLFAVHCAGCHGAAGDPMTSKFVGKGRPARYLSAIVEAGQASDAHNFSTIGSGVPIGGMPAFGMILDEPTRWKLAAFVRTLSLEGPSGMPAGSMVPDHAAALSDVRRRLDVAVEAKRRGDLDAAALASDAYAGYEPLEMHLISIDPVLMRAIELNLVNIRDMLRSGGGDIEPLAKKAGADLDTAVDLLRPLGPQASKSVRAPVAVGLAVLALALLAWMMLSARRGTARQ